MFVILALINGAIHFYGYSDTIWFNITAFLIAISAIIVIITFLIEKKRKSFKHDRSDRK